MSPETLVENKLATISSLKSSNDVDLVRSYLRDIGRVPLLSHEQEITLGRQVQEYMQVERAEIEIMELTDIKPSAEEFTVFIKVKIANLNDLSKLILLKLNKEVKINNEIINIKIVKKYLLISLKSKFILENINLFIKTFFGLLKDKI